MDERKNIEDYGFIGNMRTTALIDRNASMEWLCLPRFDSDACCAALLGKPENGYWQLLPEADLISRTRRYRGDTLVLESLFETDSGTVAVIDFMPFARSAEDGVIDVVRIVEGRRGTVEMKTDAVFRFDYGRVSPWVRYREGGILAVAGPDGLRLETPVELYNDQRRIRGRFQVKAGQQVPFVLTWYHSYKEEPSSRDALQALEETEGWWRDWSAGFEMEERFREPVMRSLITLKALTHGETGGVVAAATTSLPEDVGGRLNWDYRYTWLRDATFTLSALLRSGYREEAQAWRLWLLRAAAGDASKLQPVYGVAGERNLAEYEVPELQGFNGAQPVRIGNKAKAQQQLDIYGQVMDGLRLGRVHKIEPTEEIWDVQRQLIGFLMEHWQEKGASLWELRGPPQHYVYSKVMAWVAVDRGIMAVENYGLEGDVEQWKDLRRRIHQEVCEKGFNRDRNTFVQAYGSRDLDAPLLIIPQVGFLPIEDSRVRATIEAIQRELTYDGFVYRYAGAEKEQNLADGEGAFILCSYWLVDDLVLLGREDEAQALFDRLLGIRNDLGLLAEEYHPQRRRLLGNFPQAFSHVGLINSAHNLSPGSKGVALPRKGSSG